MVVGTDQQEEGGGGGKKRIQKKEGAMGGGKEVEEEKQRATLTEELQASNSGGDGNSLSLFYPSLVFIFLSPSASLHTSASRAVLFSRGVRPVHSVFSGGRPLPFIPRPTRSFHPALLFFFHPSRVVLVTFRFTVRVAVGPPSHSTLFQCCPCI